VFGEHNIAKMKIGPRIVEKGFESSI